MYRSRSIPSIQASTLVSAHRKTMGVRNWMLVIALLMTCGIQTGCQIDNIDAARRAARIASIGSKEIVSVKRQDRLKRWGPVRRLLVGRPDPSQRTQLFLRRNNLAERYQAAPEQVLSDLQEDCRCDPDMASVHAIAELAQLEADWQLLSGNNKGAATLFATAVVHAYQFLFDDKLDLQRNAYDPQFREICDVYNQSLENLLRINCKSEKFTPGVTHTIGDGDNGVEVTVVVEGRWKDEDFERFELVSDFEVEGIDNSYHTYGLGVPLIAIRKPEPDPDSVVEQYYPPSLALPMTAFCEVLAHPVNVDGARRGPLKAVLRLYDPLERTVVRTETRHAPLESDLTVPLAYYLDDPLLNTEFFSTLALVRADVAKETFGFYMLEPFDPNKIPVVMVHGLWSNPVTWLKMFNDLRANESIRDNYQFWFYMYPTGQPFWISAAEMRQDLKRLRNDVDPQANSAALRDMIFVGHSMGGLVSRMQTVDSGDAFWRIVSDAAIDRIQGDETTIQQVKQLFYFDADPAIRRVITIASPHRGSRYANSATRWLSHRIFSLPKILTAGFTEFVDQNRSILKNTKHLTVPTSIDSLAPDSPFIQQLLVADVAGSVRYHNIVGKVDASALIKKLGGSSEGDGVVSIESARLPGAISELAVPSEHNEVHQHPKSILEVKRILIENLVELKRIRMHQGQHVHQVSHHESVLAPSDTVKPK